jgi:hypothetical protein
VKEPPRQEIEMKLKCLVVGVLALSLGVAAAVAAPPPGAGKPDTVPPTGKGKPLATGPTCKPRVAVVLKGTFTGLAANVLTMTVTSGNRWARTWVTAGTASVTVDPSTTKVRRNGAKALTELEPQDWLLVQARACKAELEATVPPTLTAVRIVAHPAKA